MESASSVATSSCTSGSDGQAMEMCPSFSGSRFSVARGLSRRGSGGRTGAFSNCLSGQAKSLPASSKASASRTSPTTTTSVFCGAYQRR